MICRDRERGLCGFADVGVWRTSDSLDPIKPKVAEVVLLNNLLVTFLPAPSILAMSSINNCVFECSMGHRISREDARFHMHTSDGQHYLSNQQVRSCTDLGCSI